MVLAEEHALEAVALELYEAAKVSVEGLLHELLVLVVGDAAPGDDVELERPRLDAVGHPLTLDTYGGDWPTTCRASGVSVGRDCRDPGGSR